jgi:hypothetical protein
MYTLLSVMILGSSVYLNRHSVQVSHLVLGLTGYCHKQLNMSKREKKTRDTRIERKQRLTEGVAHYLSFMMKRDFLYITQLYLL